MNLTDVVHIKKFGSLLKVNYCFYVSLYGKFKTKESNTLNKIQVNPNFQPSELSISKEIIIRDNQQIFENESMFNILKRELNIVSKNNNIKV